jgi:hypothetical protein
VYLPGQKLLVTFSPSPEDMEMGDDTWKFGDEMRVAFMNTNKNKAVRVMNVTKTNIFRR